MRTFISILLLGLLGFMGCSGSNDGTSTTNTTVGEAIPVAPFRIIETSTPTYKWIPVRWATKYRLVVQETNQESSIQEATETYIIDEMYTSDEAGCASEEGLCKVREDREIVGENRWMIQACVHDDCGEWSEPMDFDFTPTNKPRYTDNGDGTVNDNFTGYTWTKQTARVIDGKIWPPCTYIGAYNYCNTLKTGGYTDWRIPDLATLQFSDGRTIRDGCLFRPGTPFCTSGRYNTYT
jgi:hypothetical protein